VVGAAKRLLPLLVALGAVAPRADACSCISPRQTESNVRDYIRRMYATYANVVLLRVVEATYVSNDNQRATLEVVKTWQGSHVPGDRIQSDTEQVDSGSCAASVEVGQELFYGFNEEPILIGECPGDFELSNLELKWLRRLSPLKAKPVS
jgi:hypothetical protein